MTEFTQAAWQYEAMTDQEKKSFVDNVTESLMFVDETVRQTVLDYFGKVDSGLEKILRKRFRF